MMTFEKWVSFALDMNNENSWILDRFAEQFEVDVFDDKETMQDAIKESVKNGNLNLCAVIFYEIFYQIQQKAVVELNANEDDFDCDFNWGFSSIYFKGHKVSCWKDIKNMNLIN